MKRGYRYLHIIQEIIYVMKLSLKIVRKTTITFLLSKTFLFFLEQKYIFSYSWKSSFYNSSEFNCLGISFAEADTKNVDIPRHCGVPRQISNAVE